MNLGLFTLMKDMFGKVYHQKNGSYHLWFVRGIGLKYCLLYFENGGIWPQPLHKLRIQNKNLLNRSPLEAKILTRWISVYRRKNCNTDLKINTVKRTWSFKQPS